MKFLLLSTALSVHGQVIDFDRTFFCDLRNRDHEVIVSEVEETSLQVRSGGIRRLNALELIEATVLHYENVMNQEVLYPRHLNQNTESSASTNSSFYTEDNSTQNGKKFIAKFCNCFDWVPEKLPFCPVDSNFCAVTWKHPSNEFVFECIKATQLQYWARYAWIFAYLLMAFLTMILLCSNTGHDVIRYFISGCFPQLNNWIVEEILRQTIARRNFTHIAEEQRSRIPAEGILCGYRLKTKVFHVNKVNDWENNCSNSNCVESQNADELEASNHSLDSKILSTPSDCSQLACCADATEDHLLCSICMLHLENNDRIADLVCKHYYHADCLSEWIKKKNNCPLCQKDGIAEEIRLKYPCSVEQESPEESCVTSFREELRRRFIVLVMGVDRRGFIS